MLSQPLQQLGFLMQPHLMVDTPSARVAMVLAGVVLSQLEIDTALSTIGELKLVKICAGDTETWQG